MQTKSICNLPGLRFKSFKTESQRIQDTLKKMAELDLVPSPELKIQYRKRVAQNDINPVFRFKPKTDSERVIDYIRNGGLSLVQELKTLKELTCVFVNI